MDSNVLSLAQNFSFGVGVQSFSFGIGVQSFSFGVILYLKLILNELDSKINFDAKFSFI
ncbi:hypothetical protein BGP_3013 [Beggiatoa sp. PS]|nr:hypothetical protein BGP_3013 [Beggiatoa sp. PS]